MPVQHHSTASEVSDDERTVRAEADGPRPRSEDAQESERRLLTEWRSGSGSALGELLAMHERRVYAVCLRMCANPDLARDLAQDTLVKVIQGLERFDERARLSTWMTRIAINVCLTNRRRQTVRRAVSLDGSGKNPGLDGSGDRGESMAAGLPDHREPDAQSRVGKGEDLDRLERAMARLEPDQRAILILRDGQDMDYADIASVLEVPEGTVKSRLFRARMALRQQIEHLGSAATLGKKPKGGDHR